MKTNKFLSVITFIKFCLLLYLALGERPFMPTTIQEF